jgi:SEC-C motif domain protein
MLCPCGSKKSYDECCLPIVAKNQLAQSPEQLMRSRYTAYSQNMATYIFNTYAKTSQSDQSIDEIAEWGESCRWVKLIIHNVSQVECDTYTSQQNLPTVHFSAFYLIKDTLFELSERSRFIKESTNHDKKEWRYLDGEIFKHEEILRIKRNDSCPCGSGKKFKKCCD